MSFSTSVEVVRFESAATLMSSGTGACTVYTTTRVFTFGASASTYSCSSNGWTSAKSLTAVVIAPASVRSSLLSSDRSYDGTTIQ